MEQVIARRAVVAKKKGLVDKALELLSGKAKEATVYDLDVIFHRQTAGATAHGSITASSRDHKLDNAPIRFAFVGISHAPLLTPDVINHIFTEAMNQGYVPHALVSYKTLIART